MNEIDNIREKFTDIYANSSWAYGSGGGSLPRNTVEYRRFLEQFISDNYIKNVTDFGCGDWQFSRFVDWTAVSYVGFDVVDALVDRNNKTFGSDNIEFRVFKTINDLPGGDLFISKEVFQHLPNATIIFYTNAVLEKYKYALVTNSVGPGDDFNFDIDPGQCRPLRLEKEPFLYRGANAMTYSFICDGVTYTNCFYLLIGNFL
jgi:SAM-dependent methyltransferase